MDESFAMVGGGVKTSPAIEYVFMSVSSLVRGPCLRKNVQLPEAEIRGLCLKTREIFLSQPILLELKAPLKICGMLCISVCVCL